MSVRVVGFVPCKMDSQRVPGKNVRPLGGSPLVNHILRALARVREIDETFVYSSTDKIEAHIEDGVPHTWLQRPEWLDTQAAKVQDFVGEFVRAVEADVYVLAHITSPFLSPATISECVRAVVEGGHDSAFAALEERRFAWYGGRPLNYDLEKPVPRTQDLAPVLFEQSGLYVFRRDVFTSGARRVGDDAFVCVVDRFEGHDIDEEEDFALAEMIWSMREATEGTAR